MATELLASIALGQEDDLRRSGTRTYHSDAVTLMTLHGSRLEFPLCSSAAVNVGIIPHTGIARAERSGGSAALYVGMTRAQEELLLLTSGAPSVFLGRYSKGPPGAVGRADGVRRSRPNSMSLFWGKRINNKSRAGPRTRGPARPYDGIFAWRLPPSAATRFLSFSFDRPVSTPQRAIGQRDCKPFDSVAPSRYERIQSKCRANGRNPPPRRAPPSPRQSRYQQRGKARPRNSSR